jgi:hypothetical protein
MRRKIERLLFCGEKRVQSRFATIGRVAMNYASLGRSIESGNQTANLRCVRLLISTGAFLQIAQTRAHAAVLAGASH